MLKLVHNVRPGFVTDQINFLRSDGFFRHWSGTREIFILNDCCGNTRRTVRRRSTGNLMELSEELSQVGQDFPSSQLHFCLAPVKIDHYLVEEQTYSTCIKKTLPLLTKAEFDNEWTSHLIQNRIYTKHILHYVRRFVCFERILTETKLFFLDSRAALCYVVQVGPSLRTGRTCVSLSTVWIHPCNQFFSRGSFSRAKERYPRLRYCNSKRIDQKGAYVTCECLKYLELWQLKKASVFQVI